MPSISLLSPNCDAVRTHSPLPVRPGRSAYLSARHNSRLKTLKRANTVFVTLLASCQLHGIEPWAYLRDLLCLLPSWPISRVLELAPAFWQQTLQQEDAQQRLAANVFRGISLVEHAPTT